MKFFTHVSLALIAMLFLPWIAAGQTMPATPPNDDGQPVTIVNARQYELTSKINGQTYRLMVYLPAKADPAKPLPVVYVLDGNYYFGTACDAMGMNQLSGIVVGVGYPLTDREEITRRRSFDLSLPNAAGSKKYGGADAFLRVVDEEVKPFIAARYKVDSAHQSLFGHSLGGLTALREMFRNPQAYSTYLITSPSIWWADRAVLKDEEAFSKRARAGELHLRVLLTSAGDEQQKGSHMIDNVTELATRLTSLNPANLKITRQIFPDETHPSGALAALCRSLRFALKPAE